MHPLGRFVACIGLAFAAILASSDAAAADCKFDTDETDKFTKERTLGTRRESLEWLFGDYGSSSDESKSSYISAWSDNGAKSLRVDITFSKFVNRVPPPYELKNTLVIPKGSRLLVMMTDGTIVTLLSAKRVNNDSRVTGSYDMPVVEVGARIRYPLNNELIAALTSQSATRLRVEAADTHYDYEIHEKSLDDIGTAIQCLEASL